MSDTSFQTAVSDYNTRTMPTQDEYFPFGEAIRVGKTRIYFRWFGAGLALSGAAALAAVGPLRAAFAGLPEVTLAGADTDPGTGQG